ncbi:hypothetical protein DXG03_004367 [Asterophora parasitica]|uniref:Uncharacterized protein n=1 Tax=Asterophora parasitica TaxID=117018 RepID=A0A9P7GCE0_9AGAR|nr:hypothetical protein DXG03_004367 [Asterophora parasitica]
MEEYEECTKVSGVILSSVMSFSSPRRIENRNLTDPDEIDKALRLGDYIKKETLALYSLRKYRHLKRMYPETPGEQVDVDVVSRAVETNFASTSAS